MIHFYFSLLQVVPGLLQLAHKSFQLCFTEEDDQDDEMDDKDDDEMDDDKDDGMVTMMMMIMIAKLLLANSQSYRE